MRVRLAGVMVWASDILFIYELCGVRWLFIHLYGDTWI